MEMRIHLPQTGRKLIFIDPRSARSLRDRQQALRREAKISLDYALSYTLSFALSYTLPFPLS